MTAVSPGYNSQMLSTLKGLHESDPFQYTLCSIVIDGMTIKTHLDSDCHAQKMVGFVDLGCSAMQLVDGQDEATEGCGLSWSLESSSGLLFLHPS